MKRYDTFVEDGTVCVGSDDGPLEVAPLDDVVDAVGGPAWTIRYTDAERRRYPDMDTDDEGMVVDVVDMLNAMTHSQRFVETLAAHPTTVPETDTDTNTERDTLSPRAGLFVGKLLENLENGVA
ncbi:hypothetical protein [Haloarcula marina]|uniref:hypothetical protein n=1 Tax=Haloarcula marina TaxID=2961574 RepID=UPI0020B8A8E2|nr:hypothetical protein [Halomicroarcula marina]